MESELILSKGGFPPLSARGCVQQLMPVGCGTLRRTLNGTLVYTGKPLAHKYRSLISCEDKASLALEGLWRGSEVRVGCIQRLWQKVAGLEVILERDPMIGSIFATTAHQERREVQEALGRKVVLAESPAGMNEDVFVSYRPWLDMRVVTFSLSTNEWGLKAGWRLELEEI
ncbi:MAG: hypothetical protein K0R76_1237 [Alphaproteobacteria bacterium]|jgi:hypothetical protein|nr:hypothetical protein [Alphaproteobacteria bacterium]